MKGTLWHEADGDFNPGWALFIGSTLLGWAISIIAGVVAVVNPKAWAAVAVALSFLAFSMLCTAIIVVPIARAKILGKGLPAAAKGISAAVQPPFPDMDMHEGDDD